MPTLREGFYDEMIDGGGTPRPHAQTLVEALEALGPDQLAARVAGATRSSCSRESRSTRPVRTPTDRCATARSRLAPRIIPAAEWTSINRGLAQRIRALNTFIDDVYHGREIVHDGSCRGSCWAIPEMRPGFSGL